MMFDDADDLYTVLVLGVMCIFIIYILIWILSVLL